MILMNYDKFYSMKRKDVIEGIRLCLSKANLLLDKTQLTVRTDEDNTVALGIYSLAIEELGKAIILQDHIREEKEQYEISRKLFRGKESHDLKFKKAIEFLPSDCTNAVYGLEVKMPNTKDQTITISPKGHKVSIPKGTTGIFMTFDINRIDFETRMSCFYIDWDETKGWKETPIILGGMITRGILYTKKEIEKMRRALPNDS